MPFGMVTRVDPRNHALDDMEIPWGCPANSTAKAWEPLQWWIAGDVPIYLKLFAQSDPALQKTPISTDFA